MKNWYEERNAPLSGTYLCRAEEIGDKEAKEFKFGAATVFPFRMFIYKEQGECKAYKNSCPHFEVPLNFTPEELFTPNHEYFLCMTHYAKFETGSGLCVEGPCKGESLERIPLKQEGDALYIAD